MVDWYHAVHQMFYIHIDGGTFIWGIELGYDWWDFVINNPLIPC